MKQFFTFKWLIMSLMLVMGAGHAWADTESVTFSAQAYTNQQAVASYMGTNFSIAFDKGTNSSNAPKYYSSGTAIRAYAGNYFTVSSTNTITKIELSFGSSDGSNTITTDVNTYKDGTWTGSANYVKFTIGGTNGNRRIAGITVTYTPAVTKTNTSLSLSPNSLNLTYGGSTGTLTATVTPEGESALQSPTISWESDDESVATVAGGVVTPVGEGSCTITASYAGDNTYNKSSNTATVNVTDNRVAVVSAIEKINSIKSLYIGGKHAFSPVVTLADGLSESDVTYSYVSADPSTIQINEDGTYTALKTGTNIDITVTATPIASKSATHKPVTATFQHNGAYKYSKPTFTPTGVTEGNFSGSMTLAMENDGTPVGPIYYTLDGNEPATDKSNATLYSDELTLTATSTVKARIIDDDGYYSTVTSATYTKVAANKDAISLAVGQSLSFTDFTAAGTYGTNKSVYLIASDGDNYKWTGSDVGNYSGKTLQIKNNTSSYITSSPVTSANGFKMTITNTGSVDVYVGETKQTADSDGAYYFSTANATAVTLKRGTSSTPQVSNITFTGLKPSRSVTFPEGNQVITVDGETITKTATVSPAGDVTYASSDPTIATVDATTGEVSAVKGGEVTITATVAADADYEKSTGSYTVTVNKAATTLAFSNAEETVELVDGTATFTATATPADETRTITYSTDDEITVNASTGEVTLTAIGDYVIKANAEATGKYLAPSEASYTLHVVDSRTPIVEANSLNLVLTDVLDNPIALNSVAKDDVGFLSATYTKAASFSGDPVVLFATSDATVLLIENGNEFTALKGGTAKVTVTVSSGGNNLYTDVEKEFTVTVTNNAKTATVITVMDENADAVEDGDELNLTYGSPVTLEIEATAGYEGTIEKELGNPLIAEVGVSGTTYTITPIAVGTTTLTLSAAETANFTAASDIVLTIKVAGGVEAKTTTELVEADLEDIDFAQYYVPDTWEMATTNSENYQAWKNNKSNDFISANAYVSSTNRKAGTYDYITDEYDLTYYQTAYIEFEHAGQYFGEISDGIKLLAKVDGVEQNLTINTYFAGTSYSSYVKNTTNINSLCGKKVKIIFRYISDGTSSNTGRWDIKNFKISGEKMPTFDVKLNANGYATFCSEYPLDLTPTDEFTAWQATGIDLDSNQTNITFEKITGTIKGGQGFLISGEPNTTVTISAANGTNELTGNLFVGTMVPTYITTVEGEYTNIGLKGDSWVKINAGNVKANKAYMHVPTDKLATGGSNVKMTFNYGEATGVIDLKTVTLDNDAWYDLTGRRVTQPKNGIFIHNGKKILVK